MLTPKTIVAALTEAGEFREASDKLVKFHEAGVAMVRRVHINYDPPAFLFRMFYLSLAGEWTPHGAQANDRKKADEWFEELVERQKVRAPYIRPTAL